MIDETTARDRAINTVEDVVMGGHASMNTARRQATAIVDALLARPEVLRALAGAPTADVAEDHIVPFLRDLANDRHPYGSGPFDADHIKVFKDDARRLLPLLAAAPEGVAAPPHPDPCSTCGGYSIVHFPGHYVPGEQFVEPPSDERCEDCVGTGMREVQERLRAAAPEGEITADAACAEVEAARVASKQIEEWWKADRAQLAAAQAAIQRVWTSEPPAGSQHYREGWRDGYEQRGIDIRRALDGDITEES